MGSSFGGSSAPAASPAPSSVVPVGEASGSPNAPVSDPVQ
jgi:hypothetical protein